MTDSEIEAIVDAQDLAVEKFLYRLKLFLEKSSQKAEAEETASAMAVRAQPNIGGVKKTTKKVMAAAPDGTRENMSEKDRLVRDLRDTITLLEAKVSKMELQVKMKEEKVRFLSKKLESDAEEHDETD